MNTLPVLAVQNLPVIVWQNQAVITSESLASVYEADATHIQDNFRKNAERFTEGQHYFKLTGQALKDLKVSLTGKFPVSRQTRHLILWTERGTVRHAKMLGTDKAWEIQDQLEQFYFSQKPPASNPVEKTEALTLANIEALIDRKLNPRVEPSAMSGQAAKLDFNTAKLSLKRLQDYLTRCPPNNLAYVQEELDIIDRCLIRGWTEMDEAIPRILTGVSFLKRWRARD